jgi:hypothetical protein
MRPSSPSDRFNGEPEGQAHDLDLLTALPTDPAGTLRIGTLSWSVPRRDRHPLAPDEFLATLKQVLAEAQEPWDLLLAAGRTLSIEPPSEEVLARTGGSAVLFEVINPGGNSARWILAHGGTQSRTDRLRSEQIIVRGGDDPAKYERLAADLTAGGGVIRHGGSDTSLILLICGENNALDIYGRGRSAFCRPGPGLAGRLGGRWVALNPAHSPYWPQSKMTGFAKVGRVGGVGETMARTVAGRGPYADGTRPPVAFVHANNFYADEPRTRAFASVAFGATARITPSRSEKGTISGPIGEEIHWIFSAYDIPV